MLPPLDRELAQGVDNLRALETVLDDLSDLDATRSLLLLAARESRRPGDDVAGVESEKRDLAHGGREVSARLYRPTGLDGPVPVLLWIHGGGYILGSAEQDDLRAQHLCANGECAVVSVDYRLAPEHAYPKPLEDCYTALAWICANAEDQNYDADRIAVGGASAGGGLAAGLALLARDRGEFAVSLQLLIYPMLDDRNVVSHGHDAPPVWNASRNAAGWQAYLGDLYGTDDVPGYAAPSRASNLRDLPPAFLPVGDADLFVAENLSYAARLHAAGVSCEVQTYAGAYHGFEMFAPQAAISRRMTGDVYAALQRAFSR